MSCADATNVSSYAHCATRLVAVRLGDRPDIFAATKGAQPNLPRIAAYRARRAARSGRWSTEAHRQSALVAAADRDSDDMDFVETLSVDWDA